MAEVLQQEYNMLLVGLSYLISVFGAFTALLLAVRIPSAKGNAVWSWTLGAAVSIGGGAIWSMHFIAMLAHKIPVTVTYDLLLTVVSLLIAIAVTAVGLFVVGRGKSNLLKLISGGVFTGLGVAGMHYTGMAAMRMAADISYRIDLVALSLVIAVVAATVALWLAFNVRGNLQKFGSALVMGVAVCGMHYTGMAATTFTRNDSIMVKTLIVPEILAVWIFVATFITLALALTLAIVRADESQFSEEVVA